MATYELYSDGFTDEPPLKFSSKRAALREARLMLGTTKITHGETIAKGGSTIPARAPVTIQTLYSPDKRSTVKLVTIGR